ncbi:alpha/beta fold hydrolase [Amycolatopsis acidiphila]|uniref:Alpha/beta hydrolase n=1 Tax=Amycolatopsis acidiphila TaxID=715473 RepID=A0A557ZVL1_9PSEU|nr:alpha/beta hydrolase [Amycolatopsis acidiphila]TVT16054.1 alpha/beta hydrolase [Amycolatopsis acidiphila]UIJ62268.1 alpha/beta fold hydrolase [Amycolatopsis acidiphila]GHG93012.1 peptidase [Amycolatopsis acidiphila]
MNKLLSALAAAGILAGTVVAAPSATAAPAAPEFDPAPIAWGACSSPSLQKAGAQCGFLEVPLDYGKPAGTKISLAVSRVRHTTAQSQGVMLVNPGGPGGSGLGLSVLGKYVPNHAGDSYDWIGFDPRGVGSSKPALSCDPDYFGYNRPNYVPTTPQLEQTWLASAKSYATACAKNGPLLEHMKTTDSAQDMESLRKALGQQQINYYGFSYGTYLGQVYSTLYPQRVRRMVLDSNVDPRKVWYKANLDQDVAFDRNIKIYFDWIAKYDSVYHLGGSGDAVEQLWYSEQKKLAQNPAGGVIGPDEWSDIFLQAGYYRFGWEDMAKAFSGWVHNGDWQTLKSLYDDTDTPGDDNGFAVYDAVQCSDVRWPTSWTKWRTDNWATYHRAPFETWGNAWYNAPCLSWPAKPGKPVTINGTKVASALLIDEELDAATPFEGSLQVRKLYPNSSLIGEPGGATHADSLSGDACVDDQVADYLATGKLPARKKGNGPDTTCAPLPDPVPSGATAAKSDTAAGQQPAELQKALAGAQY